MERREGAETEDMVDREVSRSGRLDKRYIYNGEPRQEVAGYALRPNKRGVKRKSSTFNIILILFCCGVTIVLYINNILTVNQLAFDVNKLQTKYDKIVNTNGTLRAEVNRKSALERIGPIVTDELKMRYPQEQPTTFDVDLQKTEDLKNK